MSMLLCAGVVALGIPRNVLGIPYHSPSIGEFLANAALVQNITGDPPLSDPMWSLPFEIQMYVALPVIFLIASARRWALGLALLAAASYVAARYGPGQLGYVPCFLCGVLTYRLLKLRKKPPFAWWLWPATVGILLVGFCFLDPLEMSLRKRTILCLILGLAIPLFQDCTATGVRSTARLVARYSYGIYLFHYPLMWLFYRHLDWPAPARHLGFTCLMIFVPVICYHAMEAPLMRFGGRLASRVSGSRGPGGWTAQTEGAAP